MSPQEPVAAVVLAAGLGKRMKSELPKVLHRADGAPLLWHVLESVATLAPERIVVVIGHKGDQVKSALSAPEYRSAPWAKSLVFVTQSEPLGSGDAAKCALKELGGFVGSVLICAGDAPLLRPESLQALRECFHKEQASLALLTAKLNQPGAYGRIVRDSNTHKVTAIKEARDCASHELLIDEVNTGTYLVDSAFLKPALEGLKNDNSQKEYYLTDIVERAAKEGQTVVGLPLMDSSESLGVNTPAELAQIEALLRARRLTKLAMEGVTFADPSTVLIEPGCRIAAGCKIGPNVQILANSNIAAGVTIEGCAWISNSSIGAGTHLKLGVRIEDSQVGSDCLVGPFAHLRPGSQLGDDVKIGNFVETKKAVFEKGAKASHLSYIGDAFVGAEANIGAGTITCNYDGYQKYVTKIGAGAFIGSNTSLIAPVEIGAGATVGASSAIAKNVEPDALAVTRAPQVNKPGWSKARREKAAKKAK